MARTRSGESLIDEAYDRADCIGAIARHPRVNVLRYVNQGAAELWDLLIEARGPEYYRAAPDEITTTESTTSYTLENDFYQLISVRVEDADGERGQPLDAFTSQEEPRLRDTSYGTDGFPTHYQLRRTSAGVNTLAVLPLHAADHVLVVDYVPVFTDLTDSLLSLFAGVNGWEEYIVDYAAKKMATKDEEWDLVRELREDMKEIRARIMKLAPKRDMHRARRVKDVRGPRVLGGRYR